MHLCMHIADGGELISEGAAEGVRGVDDGAAPAARLRVAGKVGRASKVCVHKSLGCMQFIASAGSLSHPC